jgi:3-deoxy-D-manno-octulosonic-acid transferase
MNNKKPAPQIFWILYNGMLFLGIAFLWPLILYSVAVTAKRRHTFRQRMGWCRPFRYDAHSRETGKCIWVHALSVGEVLAAQPMVERLRQIRADVPICLTASTFTGFQTARQLYEQQERIGLAYFPYDWIGAVRRVASQINPAMVVLTETDIWPNFLMEMHRRRVPVSLVNLRLADGSWKYYRRFNRMSRHLFNGFEKIAVQGQLDMKRLITLGINPEKVTVTGNIKFDGFAPVRAADTTTQWKRSLKISSEMRVMVAGSTHAGEETAMLQVLRTLMRRNNAPILILAPRDPLRSAEIIASCGGMGLTAGAMSAVLNGSDDGHCPQVVVVDSIGVLKVLYGLADVAFVGGSLVPCGGHNPLEPAAWGKPILFGPDMRDFPLISKLLLDARAAQVVRGADDLLQAVSRLLADPQLAGEMGSRALRLVQTQRGSVDRTLAFLGLMPSNVERTDARC